MKNDKKYPFDDEISKMVDDYTHDLNVSKSSKRIIEFCYQEGLYKMLEIWRRSDRGIQDDIGLLTNIQDENGL